MARNTELTQEQVNEVADDLHSKGIKPSPNNVRDELWSGSFSTIKQMLDTWKSKQQAEDSLFIPVIPEFAYRLVDKLHRELYLQNRRLLDTERQQLEVDRQEHEDEKLEMIDEIDRLELTIVELTTQAEKQAIALNQVSESLQVLQEKFDGLTHALQAQKIELATLSEREKQQAIQLKEKEVMLKQSEKIELALTQQLEALKK